MCVCVWGGASGGSTLCQEALISGSLSHPAACLAHGRKGGRGSLVPGWDKASLALAAAQAGPPALATLASFPGATAKRAWEGFALWLLLPPLARFWLGRQPFVSFTGKTHNAKIW